MTDDLLTRAQPAIASVPHRCPTDCRDGHADDCERDRDARLAAGLAAALHTMQQYAYGRFGLPKCESESLAAFTRAAGAP